MEKALRLVGSAVIFIATIAVTNFGQSPLAERNVLLEILDASEYDHSSDLYTFERELLPIGIVPGDRGSEISIAVEIIIKGKTNHSLRAVAMKAYMQTPHLRTGVPWSTVNFLSGDGRFEVATGKRPVDQNPGLTEILIPLNAANRASILEAQTLDLKVEGIEIAVHNTPLNELKALIRATNSLPQGKMVEGKALKLPKPEYPRHLRRKKIQGTVSVSVVIDERGNVTSAKCIVGPSDLCPLALSAAFKARFTPTTVDGEPVKASGSINYRFGR